MINFINYLLYICYNFIKTEPKTLEWLLKATQGQQQWCQLIEGTRLDCPLCRLISLMPVPPRH